MTQCRQLLLEHFPWSKVLGLPAHDAVFIFFTYLTGLFKSSVFNFFKMHSSSLANVAMFYLHSSTRKKIKFFTSLFFNMEKNWVLHIFVLQCRLDHIFIFVFKLNLASSNLPENPQGPPSLYYELNTTIRHELITITVYVLFEIILKFNCALHCIGGWYCNHSVRWEN